MTCSASDYDHQGRVVSTRTIGEEAVTTRYIWLAGMRTGGMGDFGGWQQTTTPANGFELAEQSDVFGHVVYSHGHMPAAAATHSTLVGYDRGGRMTSRLGGDGETAGYHWYNTGLLAIQSSGIAPDQEKASARYGYDAAGRKTDESFTRNGTVYTQGHADYDALGRMTGWNQADSANGLPAASMAWAYDAAGNIRRTVAGKPVLGEHGTVASRITEDRWFRYDAMIRVVLDGGLLLGGQIVRGGRGTSLTYDAAGQRATATRDAVLSASIEVWEPGEPQPDQPIIINALQGGRWVTREVSYAGVRTESFRYAADSQLDAVKILESNYRNHGDGTVTVTAAVLIASEEGKNTTTDWPWQSRSGLPPPCARHPFRRSGGYHVVYDLTDDGQRPQPFKRLSGQSWSDLPSRA